MFKLNNISDQNDNGEFILSSITQFGHTSETYRPGIKIVLSGIEDYNVNGKRYKLGADKFLIIDKHSNVDLTIKDPTGVQGICIFPDRDIIYDVFRNKSSQCEDLLANPFKSENTHLLEKTFSYEENRTGVFLKRNIPFILNNQNCKENLDFDSFYLSLAECIASDQLEVDGKLKNLTSTRKSTKEELYRRVSNAKNFIEDNFTEKINLDELAQNAYLSKFHFLRSFKSLYGLSPYQYILQLRLDKALELLSLDYSYSEVNDLIGFSDEKNLRKAIRKLEVVS